MKRGDDGEWVEVGRDRPKASDEGIAMTTAGVEGLSALKDLRLFTLYANAYTHLCSLRHRCVIAGWEGGNAQEGIPHVVLTGTLARQAGVSLDALRDDPFWQTFFDHLETHPEILGG